MYECPWCYNPVDKDGDTCCFLCYSSYYAWLYALNNGHNDQFVKLQPDDRPPKPMYLQPWYDQGIEKEDYLEVPENLE